MLKNTATLLGSLLLALLICEVTLRAVSDDLLPKPELYILDPDVGKRMRPNFEAFEFGSAIQTNSLGLRSPEVSYERAPGTFRILALGDSWTFGFHVGESESYPRQLEGMLESRARARGDPTRYEVVNTGVVGYSTQQEAAYFRVRGQRFEPDLVLLAFYPVNDTHFKMAKYERYNRLRAISPLLLDIYTFPRQLYLRQFIKGTRRLLKQKIGEARVGTAERLGYEDRRARAIVEDDWTESYRDGHPGWETARAALVEIGQTARDAQQQGLVVLLPDLTDLGRYIDRYHGRVAPLISDASQEAGLGFFDLLETFRPYRDRIDEIRLGQRRHPNPAGFGMIAEAIADEIERRYLGVGGGARD